VEGIVLQISSVPSSCVPPDFLIAELEETRRCCSCILGVLGSHAPKCPCLSQPEAHPSQPALLEGANARLARFQSKPTLDRMRDILLMTLQWRDYSVGFCISRCQQVTWRIGPRREEGVHKRLHALRLLGASVMFSA